jgi:ribosome maturation factor RimP
VSTTAERLGLIVAPVARDLGLTVYDVEDASGTLRVLLDRPGGIDVDALSTATRQISAAMEEDGTFSATSALEVSSPGLERRLRTPEHFAGAIGERVKIKLRPGVEGDRRLDGVLTACADAAVTVTPDGAEARTVAIADVTGARTEFVWGPAPKPGGPKRQKKSQQTKQPPKRSTQPQADHSEATP